MLPLLLRRHPPRLSWSSTLRPSRFPLQAVASLPPGHLQASILRNSHTTIETCPSPTRACAETPPDLDIDQTSSIRNAVPKYDQHLVIATGRSDWSSKIELDVQQEPNYAAALKRRAIHNTDGIAGDGSLESLWQRSILVTNSSFPGVPPPQAASKGNREAQGTSTMAYLLPAFQYLTLEEGDGKGKVSVQRVLQPNNPSETMPATPQPLPVRELVILICGHMSRDKRCGIIAPLLKVEFERSLARAGIRVIENPFQNAMDDAQGMDSQDGPTATIGLVSHIGGHKWAGNVIIYTPPGFSTGNGRKTSPMAGTGLWYGRVEPKHVPGIVEETIIKGKVIEELLRGGIDSQGEFLTI
ncbi:hypothetical protein MMC25_005730 [Agyrium rufum]|nr:hypothetical protein [Agyrium rufum]